METTKRNPLMEARDGKSIPNMELSKRGSQAKEGNLGHRLSLGICIE